MAKVRVHELAKELNIQSKDIISFLTENNIEKKVPASGMEDSEVEMVKNKFMKKESKAIVNSEPEQKAKEEGAAKEHPDRPKKKSSITAVFNPQNSQQGARRPKPHRRPQPDKAGMKQGGNGPRQENPGRHGESGARHLETGVKHSENPAKLQENPVKQQDNIPKPADNTVKAQEAAAKPAEQANAKPAEKPEEKPAEKIKKPETVGVKILGRVDLTPPPKKSQQDNNGGRGDRQKRQGERSGQERGNGRFGDRGGRNFDKNNQKNYQNNRGGSNNSQGDRGNRGFGSNRSKEFKGRLDQEINKFNKESVSPAEELRGKETRERGENRNKNNNRKQEHDKLGKKQERFINLEKHGGKKKPQPKPQEKEEETIKSITLPEHLTIKELADKMKIQASVIVKKLFLKGTMVTVNQDVDYDTAEEIALEFNCIAEPEEKVDVIAELLKEEEEDESTLKFRPPVVCVMGHVDHGKTSLLDAIRSTRVTDREAGGITQRIGAYVVDINGQKITFLDTPGHEAFTAMRMRGANATDIAILVVAADDGVMPQTVEAINHAKAAGIEIIVAVNKIDKPNANIERVKQELSEYELIPEDWGGSTIFCPVSAHTKEGIDNLLEMILLTAEVCELKANPNRNARGLVIEAQLDKGRGAVATILVQKGTLKVGEPIACGSCYGKVRAMMDDAGRRVKEAGPSTPVEILGLSGVPKAGEVFVSTDTEKEARSFAETFISEGKERLLEETKAKMSLDDLFSQIQSGNVKELDIIVKADVQGSVEAVKQSLEKLSNEEVVVKTIHGGVGAINESDVILASASNAIIIGFNVRPDATAKATAEREGVDVRLYKVIYNAIEDVEAAMKGMLDPIFEEKVIGHAEVRQIFKASGVGNIAGSYVLDGIFERGCKVRVTREGEQIFEGDLASLKRFKDDVKEVRSGYECGLVIDGFNDIAEFDQIEAYKMVEVPR